MVSKAHGSLSQGGGIISNSLINKLRIKKRLMAEEAKEEESSDPDISQMNKQIEAIQAENM